jgi:alkylation response protein AidB-like acyl-CoA dehydrogenase
MLLGLTDDQQLFRETTVRYLTEHAPVAEVRRLRDDPAGFEEKYWRGGADLGWTSLLVDEAHGGGTISGSGLHDLAVIAYEFGRHAAPGPLLATNIVASALSGSEAHATLLAELIAGTAIASPATGPTVTVDDDTLVIDGVARPVESAAQATHFLVTPPTFGPSGPDSGPHAPKVGAMQVLVPAATARVTIEAMGTVDLTRRFGVVTFDNVRVPLDAEVDGPSDRQHLMALVLSTAESVGAMQAGFDMTVEWAFDRYSFGRPLSSYQALKHKYADMKVWLEASHAISAEAVAAVADGAPDAEEVASVAKAYVGEAGSQLLHDCVQMHGGIGVTFDHDLHLFLRRHTVNRTLHGTPSEHRQRVATLAAARELG